LQLYKQTNFGKDPEDKDKSRMMFFIMALVSRYCEPSAGLKPLISSWLLSKKDDKQVERFVKATL